MASSYHRMAIFMSIALVANIDLTAGDGLSYDFYAGSCPQVFAAVKSVVQSAIDKDRRMGACLLRLFYHDCFVNGCDASVLLDDIPPFFIGEKNVLPNKGSACGFEVIDQIKNVVEMTCPGLVSCADIIAIAARDSVGILGGPKWEVQMGRRDARTANPLIANLSIPTSKASRKELMIRFGALGLNPQDLVALSGAHTLGKAQCKNFRERIHGNYSDIDENFAAKRRAKCPRSSGSTNLAPIDGKTPFVFDNSYYKNLVEKKGLLHSDQQIFSGGEMNEIVNTYAVSQESFFMDFVSAMIKMGSINPLIDPAGEVRILCRSINPMY